MQRDLKALFDGGIGGLAGTATMSLVMQAAHEAGLFETHPPEEIAGAALDAVGKPKHSEETQDALALVMHFAFGIGLGTVFALLHRRLKLPIPAALHGVVFGTLLWGASYKGWVPALGIMPPTERDQPGRPQSMLFAHWVYGATLGVVVSRLGSPNS